MCEAGAGARRERVRVGMFHPTRLRLAPPKAPAARTADLIELERAGAERSSSSERSEA